MPTCQFRLFFQFFERYFPNFFLFLETFLHSKKTSTKIPGGLGPLLPAKGWFPVTRCLRLRMGRPLKRHKKCFTAPRRASEKGGKVFIFECILLMNEGNHAFCVGILQGLNSFRCECTFHIQHSINSSKVVEFAFSMWMGHNRANPT